VKKAQTAAVIGAAASTDGSSASIRGISIAMLVVASLLLLGVLAPDRAVASMPGGRVVLQWRLAIAALGMALVCAVVLTLLAGGL
jgi:hypothetical protein